MPSRELRALATDYDRTLTDLTHLKPVPRVLDALARARRAGGRVIIVSGRPMDHLEEEVGHVADALVAENGALLKLPGSDTRRLGPDLDAQGALATLAIPIEHGAIMSSAAVEHEPLLRATLAAAGIEAALVRNRDRVMILPHGVDKALGVLAALGALQVAPEECAAAGDGENDLALFQAVGFGIAVANAVDELKAVAGHVTAKDGGEGLADWVERSWLPSLEGAR